jgi:nicotinamide mononucleotide adenylyltransferase
MKSFLEVILEKETGDVHHVMSFGRMNPPTTGHLKLIDKVKDVAKKQGADHSVVVSHSQDTKKNPLSAAQKLKHLKRYSPDTNFEASSKEKPTFLQHAAHLHKQGVTHLHMVVGSDRVKEMHDKLHQYNGTHLGALYNFKKITVHSAGQRDPDAEGTEGMSGTKMREHAKNNDLQSFKKGVPSHVPEHHVKELMHDVRKGMGLHEDYSYGRRKAIFVTGGPGSGKDIIVRECIASQKIVEHNFSQVLDILNDKHKLAMRSMNPKYESVRTRSPLIVNGPADDLEKIGRIKEELEELGYQTMMVFVDTTDTVSKERNTLLSKMMMESIRQEKWQKAQQNAEHLAEMFTDFVKFDNSGDLESKEEDITETYKLTKEFLSSSSIMESIQNGNRFRGLYESSKTKVKVLKDNNSPFMQFQKKLGKQDDVRDGDEKSNSTYAFRTYAEANFNKDKETDKKKTALSAGRVGDPGGLGQTMNARSGGGSSSASIGGAGLGNQTYNEAEEFDNKNVSAPGLDAKPKNVSPNPLGEKKRFKGFKESVYSGDGVEMGVVGVMGGAMNKEPLVKPTDKYIKSGITIKNSKEKSGAK